LLAVFRQRWVRLALTIWAIFVTLWGAFAAYDPFVSQFVPRASQEKWPKVPEMIGGVLALLPWWAWGWIATAIIAVGTIEYAVRLQLLVNPSSAKIPSKRTAAVLHMDFRGFELGSGQPQLGIHGSANIRHLEWKQAGVLLVEFKDPVDPHTLTAREVHSGLPVTILEKSKYRASFQYLSFQYNNTDIIFECEDA
jgi:hypothetical protein